MYSERYHRNTSCGGDCRRCDYKRIRTDNIFTIYDKALLEYAIEATYGTEFHLERRLVRIQSQYDEENIKSLRKTIKQFYKDIECKRLDDFGEMLGCNALLLAFSERMLAFLSEYIKSKSLSIDRLFD